MVVTAKCQLRVVAQLRTQREEHTKRQTVWNALSELVLLPPFVPSSLDSARLTVQKPLPVQFSGGYIAEKTLLLKVIHRGGNE